MLHRIRTGCLQVALAMLFVLLALPAAKGEDKKADTPAP